VSIIGTGFSTDTNNIDLNVNSIPWTIVSATETEIVARSGVQTTYHESKIILKSNGNIAATLGKSFDYIDNWSSMTTWGGASPPREGDIVSIPVG
jgi:hypothetical protein